MKKFLMIVILLFLLIVIGLFVFVMTLDVNRYKPLITEKIEDIIKKDVNIGNISLNLFPRTVIRMNGVSIKDIDKTWDDVMLKAGLLEAHIKLLPLLRKDVQIDNLTIRGMDINLKDFRVLPSSDLKLEIIEAVFQNISMYGPIQASGRLSFFGRGRENIAVKAVLYPEIEIKKPYLKNVEIDIDLSRFDLVSALDALGQSEISQQFAGKEISGVLTISSDEIYLDPRKIYDSDIYFYLSDGATDILPVGRGIDKIQLKAGIREGGLTVEKLVGLISGGSFSVKGTVKDFLSVQNGNLDIKLQDISLGELLPDTMPGDPYMEGMLGIDMDCSFRGLDKEKAFSTMKAEGAITLDKAVLNNMNVLAVSLDQLNMLPGLVQKLKSRLPERYKELLKQNYTAFKPIEQKFYFNNGQFLLQDFLVESDTFYVRGQCSLGIDRKIYVSSYLFIPEDLSLAFIGIVRELEYLQNKDGMITMPLEVTGTVPDIKVMPDLSYVINKLAVSKGQELLESIFKKKEGQKPAGDSGEVPDETQEGGQSQTQDQEQEEMKPEEAIIRTIFDIIGGSGE